MDLGLKGRKALVTGGSRGIGRAIAEALAAEGAAVAICARQAEGVAAAARELAAHGVPVFGEAVDVGDGAAFRQWVADAAAALGGIDVFVSNTSGGAGQGEAGWYSNFEVDMMGAVRGVEAAMPFLQASEAASVVFISTTAAVETFGQPGGYGAMKAALINYANALSQSLAPKQIRVNTVSPGPTYFEGGPWAMIERAIPQFFEATMKSEPMGRMGSAEDVARAVAFLASPAAGYITGVNLVVDGGFTRRVNF